MSSIVYPWGADPCLLCVILLVTIDGVLTMLSVLKKRGGGSLGRCAQTGHRLKLSSPTKLARLGHFPPASQAGHLAGLVLYMSFLCVYHRVHRVATAAYWRTFSHEGKISPGWWGWGGARPPSLITFTITSKVAMSAPAEWADTLTLFHL